jgi:ABC-2 type transport system ATP-binding protein
VSNPIITTESLSYQFRRSEKILDNVSLNVPAGSIYGFLGPNGAGKTTTLRLILGLLKKQKGNIIVFGKSITAERLHILRHTGSLIEQPSLYSHLTGRENLELYRLAFRLEKKHIERVLNIVQMKDAAGKKVKAYSLGMKQRLSIAIALLHDPRLLILDEPTNGLDPNGIIETRELIVALNRQEGKTILVSSHLLSEIEKMSTHVGIINRGKLLFQDSLQQLQILKSKQSILEVEVDDIEKSVALLKEHFTIKGQHFSTLSVAFESREKAMLLNQLLVQSGIGVSRLVVQQNDLEKLFIEITREQ